MSEETKEHNKTFDWSVFLDEWVKLYEEMKPQIEIRLQIERSVRMAKARIDHLVDLGTEKQDARIREFNSIRTYNNMMRSFARYHITSDRSTYYDPYVTLMQRYSWEY